MGSPAVSISILVPLLILYLAGYSCGCPDDNRQYITCNFDGKYTSPEIREIIDGTATDLARVTIQHSNGLVSTLANILGGLVGIIPGGSIVAGIINEIGGAIGGNNNDEILANMYNDLATEVENLRKYVDAKMEYTTMQWVKSQFGDTTGGIVAMSLEIDGEMDLYTHRDALDDLHDVLVMNYLHFAPIDDSVISYERTLPLFRQYGDLFVSTLVEEIDVFKQLNDTAGAARKVTELQTRVDILDAHYTKAFNSIVAEHTSIGGFQCCDSELYYGWWEFATLSYYRATCTQTLANGQSCTVDYDRTCKGSNWYHGPPSARNNALNTFRGKRNEYISTRTADLTTYWTKEVKDVVDTWKEASQEAAKLQAACIE